MNHSTTKRIGRQRRGASAVETALMLPLLVIVTFGAIDVSQYVSTAQVITNASREAARVASRNDTQSVSEVESAVLDYLVAAMPYLTRDEADEAVTVQVRIVTGTSGSSTAQLPSLPTTRMLANLHRPLLFAGSSLSVSYLGPLYGGNGKGNGNGNGNSNSGSSNSGSTNGDGNTGNNGSDNTGGNTYDSIPPGGLSEVESGTAISVQVDFDFEAIRWLSGPTYGLHSTETVCRRE